MKILVIGAGGREHALVWRLAQGDSGHKIYAAPGNPGMAKLAECLPIYLEAAKLLRAVEELDIDLTIVGPEAPLVTGIVDDFRAKGRRIVGPTKANARLESSKAFAKQFFVDHGIPTARFDVSHTPEETAKILDRSSYPVVIKADGLAAGKGVVIAHDRTEAVQAALALGPDLVIEEFLTGEEVSFIVLADGRDAIALEPCQDHKRIHDGDEGPNTGGMGSYCDSRILSAAQRSEVMDRIILPTIQATGFTGFLYAGLMMTRDGPKLLEYNVRLGDPETQSIMHRMTGDLSEALLAAAEGRLAGLSLGWNAQPSVCVVMASAGYPQTSQSGVPIRGIAEAEATGATVFHAGTKQTVSHIETAGGRVLGVTARGATLAAAIRNAYQAVQQIAFEGMHYRTDIGRKGLGRWDESPLQ